MSNDVMHDGRRGFVRRAMGLTGLGVAGFAAQAQDRPGSGAGQGTGGGQGDARFMPRYARSFQHKSLKHSSYDRTGGNRDFWTIPAGGTQEVFNATGPGMISHIWFTIAARSGDHLKELVLRAWWDGNAKPSVEAPIGDFFGLNLNSYQVYQSEYLACSPGRSLNCYFAMPYRSSARMAVTNEGKQDVNAFYSNIDYMTVPRLPDDALYFHAQYRQSAPTIPSTGDAAKTNPDGKANYVYVETRGRGHLMGVTFGILQNSERWWGEGDDMIFIDDEAKPAIIGTGSEDYFLGSWNFGGRDGAQPFAHQQYGAQLIQSPERTGGRYCCYRFHGDNPVTFERYLKHTMEHGHSNDRGDNFFSVAYWYQAAPFTDFPALPPVEQRIPKVRTV